MNIEKNDIEMKKIMIIYIVFSISFSSHYSQNKTIKGKVISDDFETLPGVLIMINDTIEVGRTVKDGFFQINIPGSVKIIELLYPGMEITKIKLVDTCDNIEVIMMYQGVGEFISLKRAERRRKRRFKRLSKIHKQAFEKGIFKTKCPCYIRQFEPLYLKDD